MEYNEAAKEIMAKEKTIEEATEVGETDEEAEKDLEKLYAALQEKERESAKERSTTPEAQHKIFEIQREKRKIFDQLKEDIANLDNPEYYRAPEKGARHVTQREDGLFHVVNPSGIGMTVTKGEIMTDMVWGMNYYLDETMPRNVRKRHLIERAHFRLEELLNKQIITDYPETGAPVRSIGKIEKLIDKGQRKGFLAERMVENFLKKMIYDNNTPFGIEGADVYTDTIQKIDFIIKKKLHKRGVGVNKQEKQTSFGIQFSIGRHEKLLKKKKKKFNAVYEDMKEKSGLDDIIFVNIPLQGINELYNTWARNRVPGGPDKLWDDDTKETLLRGLLQGIMTEEEIDEEVNKVTGRERLQEAA
ncbi:hypothetical protein L0Y46_01865 [bacterium]|nr:hypothetical protein [bacterium]